MTENTALVPQNSTTEITSQFGTQSGFELLQRQAQMLANSSMVPEQFSIFDKVGKIKPVDAQKYAVANSIIALEISQRLGASPLMVAQNLIVIHGRPTWSSQFVIAAINASGRFSPLRFDLAGTGDDRTCTAWTLEKRTNDRLEGPPVSISMAKKEGWYGKNGSKWQTMPELMLRYRAAAFFGRLYAPDLLMGMRSVDEAIDVGDDIIDVTPEATTISDLNAEIKGSKAVRKMERTDHQKEQQNSEQIAPTISSKPEPVQVAGHQKTADTPQAEPAQDSVHDNGQDHQEAIDTGAIPPQIVKELADIDSKMSSSAIDTWLLKHHRRCIKLHGDIWWKFISDHSEKRRSLLNAEPAPGEAAPAPVVEPSPIADDDGIVMIACPEAGGREIPRSDCESGDCHINCSAYNGAGAGNSKLTMDV